MYNHLTTCEPPRPSLGKRIDLSDYQDPSQLLESSVVVPPVSVVQPSPVCTNPTVPVAEPVLSYTSVPTATFPLHSPGLLDTGAPMGEQALWPHILESPYVSPAGVRAGGLGISGKCTMLVFVAESSSLQVAPLVKYLLYEHEDWRSDPQH